MKRIILFLSSALLLSTVFFNSGCKDDNPTDLGPLIQITTDPATSVVGQNSTVTFTIDVTKGDSPLQSLTIKEDGTNVSASRIQISGITTPNNPQLITGTDKDGFTWTITVDVQDAFDTRTYTVQVTDEAGNTDDVTFDVEVQEPLTDELEGVLWNQAGPAGRGGIDLETGNSTGTGPHPNDPTNSYQLAEVRDMGIDSTAGSGDNWRRRIGPINGTEVRILGSGAPEGFDFEKVESKEAIEATFDAADDFTATLSTWPSTYKVSPEVQVGDIFVVRKDNTYFLVRVDNVTETTTLGNNEDNYEVSIKY